jgi:hypothetical protein
MSESVLVGLNQSPASLKLLFCDVCSDEKEPEDAPERVDFRRRRGATAGGAGEVAPVTGS